MSRIHRRTQPLRQALLSAASLLSLTACGDGLVDRQFHGDPLITVRGNVKGTADILPLEEPLLRLSIFWSPRGPRVSDALALIEQPSISTQSIVPFSFTLNVFDIPQAQHFSMQSDGSLYGIGTPLGYYDSNGNGRRDSSEPFLASTKRVLVYAPQDLSAAQSPVGRALSSGYYQAAANLDCPLPAGSSPRIPPPPVVGADCSSGLGQACSSDAECGTGVCLREFIAPWPQGGCVLPDPLPAGCGSQGLVRISAPTMQGGQGMPGSTVTYWLKSCTQSSDCARSFPYQCDISYGACLPTLLVDMNVAETLPTPRWCR